MRPYQVSQVNKYINKTLSTDVILSDLKVEGEISDFLHHYSGHMYFDLKDEDSRIRCVMFKGYNQKLDIELEDGMKVIIKGGISVYEKNGVYQLYAREVTESGKGELFKKFEKLKKKLEKEGLFKEEYKKELPELPKKIGIVTSATGAAVKDIITVIDRRFPSTNILLYPSLVQGDSAPKNIIKGLKYLDAREDVDLIIFGRGGGATEELFIFNDEELARVIFDLETPCISAVGHEIDFTISDFVADVRAATPSAAAELAVPDIRTYKAELDDTLINIKNLLEDKVYRYRNENSKMKRELEFLNPMRKVQNYRIEIDGVFDKVRNAMKDNISRDKHYLLELKGKLELLNPKLGIDRGYGLVTDGDGKIVRSITDLSKQDRINLTFKDGQAKALVEDIEED